MINFINIDSAEVPGAYGPASGRERRREAGLWAGGTAAERNFVQEEVLH